MAKNTICLWYEKDAEAAAHFYAETFPDSAIGAITRAPGDFPSGKEGDVLLVEFTVAGIPCVGLNGGDTFRHSEAFSGAPSPAMAAGRANAAGARTAGAFPGRSRRGCCWRRWRPAAPRPSACSTR